MKSYEALLSQAVGSGGLARLVALQENNTETALRLANRWQKRRRTCKSLGYADSSRRVVDVCSPRLVRRVTVLT